MAIVSLQRVSKDYLTDGQRVHALDDVSLEVERGQFIALVGRSGCGKSTLLNLAGAMDFPTSGNVLLDGADTAMLHAVDAGLALEAETLDGDVLLDVADRADHGHARATGAMGECAGSLDLGYDRVDLIIGRGLFHDDHHRFILSTAP